MTRGILINSLLSLLILLFGCNQPARLPATTVKTNSSIMRNSADSINSKSQKEMITSGVDFTASGNEPFWSLEIDFDKDMHFKTPGGFEIITPVPKGERAMDANVTRYAAKTEQGLLTIQIAQLECINDMSGKKSDYNVTVDVKTNTDKNYTTYKGCGNYITDSRLNEIKKDNQGCSASMGEVWSVIKNKCIYLSVAAIRLNPVEMKDKGKSPAYLIFSNDKSEAELYLPENNSTIMLERKGKEGNWTWQYQDLILIPWKGYVLKKGNLAIYGGA
jgi:uncharacterized membrane protein